MSSRPASSTSRVITFLFIALALGVVWVLAPWVLPVWRWMNVDFEKIAKERKVDRSVYQRQFEVEVSYQPRGGNDPRPWVIVTMKPSWAEVDENHRDEDHYLIRCNLISDRDGQRPSKFLLGSGHFKDRFFKAKAWRFPPGTFDIPGNRPVLLYEAMTFETIPYGQAEAYEREFNLTNLWEKDEDDSFRTAGSP